jgi:hypothetical protein
VPRGVYPTDHGWKFNGPLETSEIANMRVESHLRDLRFLAHAVRSTDELVKAMNAAPAYSDR